LISFDRQLPPGFLAVEKRELVSNIKFASVSGESQTFKNHLSGMPTTARYRQVKD
jgi:hypothetical protein